jgi:hypothetical protein
MPEFVLRLTAIDSSRNVPSASTLRVLTAIVQAGKALLAIEPRPGVTEFLYTGAFLEAFAEDAKMLSVSAAVPPRRRS